MRFAPWMMASMLLAKANCWLFMGVDAHLFARCLAVIQVLFNQQFHLLGVHRPVGVNDHDHIGRRCG